MSKERELLESCLDEMQYHSLVCPELVFEIQELLAQPEQEPVEDRIARWYRLGYEQGKKASKQEPLSDEEIAILWGDKYSGKTFMVRNFARAIEKAHGIGGGE
jgi:hypothetical protein